MKRFIAIALMTLPLTSFGHGLSPSRLEAPSGSKYIAYKFTALNNYPEWEQYAIQCFKNDLNHPYECKSSPQLLNIAPKKSRIFRTQIQPDEDAVYLVCTIQTKEASVVTRVCARFGVGMSPSLPADGNRVNKPTKYPSIPAGSRQG